MAKTYLQIVYATYDQVKLASYTNPHQKFVMNYLEAEPSRYQAEETFLVDENLRFSNFPLDHRCKASGNSID